MERLKEKIENAMIDGNAAEAKGFIEAYEEKAPEDAELISMKVNYYLLTGDIEQAAYYGVLGIRRLPLNVDMHYNLAYIYEITEQYLEAFVHYARADYLCKYAGDSRFREGELWGKASEMLELFVQWKDNLVDKLQKERAEKQLQAVLGMEESHYGLYETAFHAAVQIVGKFYYEDMFHRRFVGVFKDQFLCKHSAQADKDVIHLRGEFLKAEEGRSCHVAGTAEAERYLFPIASREKNNMLLFCKDDKQYQVLQRQENHFNYYPVERDMDIVSVKECCFGHPIPMVSLPGRKKLVLNIFVDGLAQSVLSGSDFEKVMPHTCRFFGKGTVCTRAYSASEWTYPSIASYATGLDTTHHMMFHNELDCAMPLDAPTLAEYFKEEGYYTAMFGGNWRIIPSYGHARGYDRFVYQHQKVGYKVHEVISDVLDHIEAFYETNQFIWLSIGDLHDIADEDDLPVAVQKDLPLEARVYEEQGSTSVKQAHSVNKKISYTREAVHVDKWLSVLYDYIEKHYAEDDIVVSLFSDHGQGYLIEKEGHFLAKERSNVAFMFRGGQADRGEKCEEVVSALDYCQIMCSLADVRVPLKESDGSLPVYFGGTKERKFALTESIHPNDPYRAALFMQDKTFFFTNPSPVTVDGRFLPGKYEYWLADKNGERLDDEAETEKCLQVVLKHIAPLLICDL